jgi:hypothetical protein
VEKFEDLQAKHVEYKYAEVHPSGEQLAVISQLVDQGKLRAIIDQVTRSKNFETRSRKWRVVMLTAKSYSKSPDLSLLFLRGSYGNT